MTTLSIPFHLGLDLTDLASFKPAKEITRRVSDLRDHFSDHDAVNRALADGDPIVYRFYEVENHEGPRGLSFGVTVIYPGNVGQECYMTKGHFHSSPGDEIYITLKGKGKLLLYSKEGDVQTHDMLPGIMSYIPTAYAHRTVNAGAEDFIFLAVWPPIIAHDYESVLKYGFPQLVVKSASGVEVIENPRYPKP